MIVLEYSHNDYTIRISSTDINGSWLKFKGRVEEPLLYAKYQADPSGKLQLYDYTKNALSDDIAHDDWNNLWPVFFETNDYSISIYFKQLSDGSKPRIIHPDKSIEDMFNYIPLDKGGTLNSTLHFLNEPGHFDLSFIYEKETGIQEKACFGFDVVSPKLDTKKDLNTIIKAIKAEYDDLVFRYLTLTVREYSLGKEAKNDLIWLSIFKQIIEKYIIAVRYILHVPHFKDTPIVEYKKPDYIKIWTEPIAEQYCNERTRDLDAATRKYYRIEQVDTTLNTIENRFVKYTIGRIAEKLRTVLKHIQIEDVSDSEISILDDYAKQLEILRQNSFFRSIGRFEGFRQESMVLQQRNGYAQVYRYWIMLQNGLALIEGDNSIGVQPVWKLYELWCFLEVKRNVENVLGLDRHKPEDQVYITEDTSKFFDPFKGGDLTGSTTYTNKNNGDRIEIGYQYSFENKFKSEGIRSMTVEQKPDIVMHIHKKDGFTLTYLFDAKYRVQGMDDDKLTTAKDAPVEDTLNQMHRYRDSIYYKLENHNLYSKEVVGGYILFPGRLDEEKYLKMINEEQYDDLPYYLKSIEYVNIGAFPLLPNENSGKILNKFITRILTEETKNQQLDYVIPQKGLYYSHSEFNNNVIFACYKSKEHLEWIKRTYSYNLRLDKNRRGAISINNDYTHAKYLVLYAKGDKSTNLIFELTGETEITTKDELLALGYPAPGGNYYYKIKILREICLMDNKSINLSDSLIDTKACIPQVLKNYAPEILNSRI